MSISSSFNDKNSFPSKSIFSIALSLKSKLFFKNSATSFLLLFSVSLIFISFKVLMNNSFSFLSSSSISLISFSSNKNNISPSKSNFFIISSFKFNFFFKNFSTSSLLLSKFILISVSFSFSGSLLCFSFFSFKYSLKLLFSSSVISKSSTSSGFNKLKLCPSSCNSFIDLSLKFNLIFKNLATSSSMLFSSITISGSGSGSGSFCRVSSS